MDRDQYIEVATATESREQANTLAKVLVEARLAAGAQVIGPVGSAFWHDGQFGMGEEFRLVLKTRGDKYDALEGTLIEHHPWTNPEITAKVLDASSDGYTAWMDKTLDA
ncbi:Divalent-cation tolerance protein CutA [Streptomyces sp. YIM 130001]|uniref:divalent-cation tolerance protein CutA n=1 Tax=Streptomyces sp. YIM 130001 TaxID=2259644 RepID=UPI000E6463C5|nr:divalent-cation tolerance protein CutA [Streptomyces sp. YIM 130001]RII13357.1 Divalent-cation tolerance protein CutA [Streptomyces sp. YIM 130001]